MIFSRLERTGRRATTTSATGRAPAAGGARRSGFTLLEIVLVLALIGFLSTLFYVGTGIISLDSEGAGAEQAFWDASKKASLEAILSRRPVTLRFDEENQLFLWENGEGEEQLRVLEDAAVEVSFLPAEASTDGYVLIAGRLVETRAMPTVTFYPDGTCSPFRVQILRGTDRSVLEIDQWTCAPILKREAALR